MSVSLSRANGWIYAVPVMEHWLVHSPLHRISALVNSAAIESIRAGSEAPAVAELRRLLSAPVQPPMPPTGDPCPDFLGIIPTRACNIGCVYCNFGGPTAEAVQMDPLVARAAVDWTAETLARHGREILRIHFFGGEPFVAGEIVDLVVHRARYVCARWRLTPYFDASTNGVFNEARCQFIGDYFDAVVLSFDGPPEFHDRNRPAFDGRPTFDVVARTARRLSQTPVKLCLRVCITAESVNRMADVTEWMIREFNPAVVNFETITESELTRAAGLFPPDPYSFARNCIQAIRLAEKMGVRAIYSASEIDDARWTFCPVGSDAMIVGLEGRASACYLQQDDWRRRGLDLDLAVVRPDGTVDVDREAFDRVRRLTTHKPRCERCYAKWTCAGGCHVNHSYPGCTDEFDDFCIQTRLLTAFQLLRRLDQDELVDCMMADQTAMELLGMYEGDVLAMEARR